MSISDFISHQRFRPKDRFERAPYIRPSSQKTEAGRHKYKEECARREFGWWQAQHVLAVGLLTYAVQQVIRLHGRNDTRFFLEAMLAKMHDYPYWDPVVRDRSWLRDVRVQSEDEPLSRGDVLLYLGYLTMQKFGRARRGSRDKNGVRRWNVKLRLNLRDCVGKGAGGDAAQAAERATSEAPKL